VPPVADAPVVVVGGGIAGLCAALTLQQSGVPFQLFEAAPRLGGVIRTERTQGFVLEAGPDAILAQKPAGLALCRSLGLGDRLVPTNQEQRTIYVLRDGTLHPLPEGAALGVPRSVGPLLKSRLFSWSAKLRMARDLVIPARRETADESIASFVDRRLGPEALRLIGEPLLAGIHAGDPARLSVAATFPRLVELEQRHGSLIRGLRATAPPRDAGAVFYSLPGGLQELVDALVARLPAAQMHTDLAVQAVVPRGAGWTVKTSDGATHDAGAVVIAVPPREAASLVKPISPEAAEMLASVRSVSTATVLLGYRRQDVSHPLDGYGFLVPRGEGLRTSACTFVSTKLPGRAPGGHVLLRGFLGGSRDPDVLYAGDAALVAVVAEELRPLVGLRSAPVLARVFRWPDATPQMEVGHLGRMARLAEAVARVPGLHVTGAGLRGTGIPDTIADATQVAAAAVAFQASRNTRAAHLESRGPETTRPGP
jgi:protoporphyrinogen/coproporphyrinogen III oxidase